MATTSTDTFLDHEFGRVRLRTSANAKYIRLRVRPDGNLSITMPKRVNLRQVERLIDQSRESIRESLQHQPAAKSWQHGDRIGASHTLYIQADPFVPEVTTSVSANRATILHHPDVPATKLQSHIRSFVMKLLRKQANAYLPRRLQALAKNNGFAYSKLRLSNAETRWGSCSSSGTISLNIWLMTLPPELIDYVLIHELAHTREMNHSPRFWQQVENCLPTYKILRRELKRYNPVP